MGRASGKGEGLGASERSNDSRWMIFNIWGNGFVVGVNEEGACIKTKAIINVLLFLVRVIQS